VILARSEGMSTDSIAQAQEISVQSVYRYLAEYEVETKTKHDLGGVSKIKLNELQAKELNEHLQKTTYLHLKSICKYIREKYDVKYTISGTTFWLKEQGFVYKEPIKVPSKLNPKNQEVFIEAYEAPKTGLPEGEEIYFMDAVNPEF